MSELAVTPFPLYNPQAPIADRLRFLNEYSNGFLRAMTRLPDIPDAYYSRALATDQDQRPYTFINADRLQVSVTDEAVVLGIWPAGGGDAVPLALEDVEDVRVDHPLSHYMPLGGQRMMPAGVLDHEQGIRLRWLSRSTEFGYQQRMADGILSDFPQVGVVDAYNASIDPFDREAQFISLDEAKAKARGVPMSRFLLTRLGHDRAVITTRMWYPESRSVQVCHPKDAPDMPAIKTDCADTRKDVSDEDLLQIHLDRVARRAKADRRVAHSPLGHMAANELFLYAVHD